MFEIHHIFNKTANHLEVYNSNKTAFAKIDLNLGGSLQELVLKGKTIISSNETLPYETSYASAILFPFANRIADGKYSFNDKSYQLPVNKHEENNAIHGLVYNKVYDVIDCVTSKGEVSIYLRYVETNEAAGFPFKYAIDLIYFVSQESIKLVVKVGNLDNVSFPFTLGWHPYFVCSDLSKSTLDIDCKKKISVNTQQVPIHEEAYGFPSDFQLNGKELDDCFILNNNQVCFKTPEYKMNFNFSSDENYLQLYIPPNRKTIAIEPQTGAANNFNDKRGLKVLHPQENFQVKWQIEIE